MIAATHGADALVHWAGRDLSSYFRSANAEASADTADASAFGTKWRKYVAGLRDGTLSLEGLYDDGQGAVDEILYPALGADHAPVTYWPAGDARGEHGFGMLVTQSSYSVTSPMDDVTQISAEAQSSAGAERVRSLLAMGEQTASGDGQTVDDGAESGRGAVVYLHVHAVTAGTVAVAVEHSPDDSTYVELAAFEPAGLPGGQRIVVDGAVDRYVRATWTFDTGPAVFAVALGRRPSQS